MKTILLSLITCYALVLPTAHGEDVTLTVIAWNLQSGNSSADLLATQAAEKGVVDLWGFSELHNKSMLNKIEAAVEAEHGLAYEQLMTTRTGADDLGILYNAEKLDLIESHQDDSVRVGKHGLRPVLIAEFEGKTTGQRFLFMVNHLKSNIGDPEKVVQTRVAQSEILNDLTAAATLPVICCGDLNYLFSIDDPDGGSEAFDALTADGVLQWLEPEHRVKTEDSPGKRNIFDFILVGNPIPGWEGESVVLEREGNITATTVEFPRLASNGRPDDRNTTDHRPVKAVFTFTDENRQDAIAELRSRIEVLQELIAEMQQQVELLEAANSDSPP